MLLFLAAIAFMFPLKIFMIPWNMNRDVRCPPCFPDIASAVLKSFPPADDVYSRAPSLGTRGIQILGG
jgi:hypothetical protein